MKAMACDRCLKVKGENDLFYPVYINPVHIDLCEDCFGKFCDVETPYNKAIRVLEEARQNALMEFVYGKKSKNSNDK